MFDIWEHDDISFREQADKLFNLPAFQQSKTGGQQFIPFLGAGVSISARPVAPKPKPVTEPDSGLVEETYKTVGLEGESAKLFMRMAIYLALCIEAAEKDYPNLDEDQLLDRLRDDISPPSARQLARLFANLSTYSGFKKVVDNLSGVFPKDYVDASERQQVDMLKRLARITRIADPPDPLTSITSYFENKVGRGSLWTNLSLVISGKKEVTPTHKLLAAAAKRYFEQPDVLDDFLILTTNYDCLMEDALDRIGVDYVALTTRKSDQKVLVRFSDTVRDAANLTKSTSGMYYPDKLFLRKPKPLVIVCKMHGCLNSALTEKDDGLVISDNDYVNYISQMNSPHGIIPSYVNTLMQDKPFLFLGYSLNDWNVRSVFETIRKKRGEDFGGQDYAVMWYVGEYERLFFKQNGVAILKTDLNAFSDSTVTVLKKLKEGNPALWGEVVDRILSWTQ
ncbi:MAG TPA: SIR2 family protein [Pyrinomonadaceae bacterium]|nr:SIR2 family protein [Pyrinomonadaceae bacterium]